MFGQIGAEGVPVSVIFEVLPDTTAQVPFWPAAAHAVWSLDTKSAMRAAAFAPVETMPVVRTTLPLQRPPLASIWIWPSARVTRSSSMGPWQVVFSSL